MSETGFILLCLFPEARWCTVSDKEQAKCDDLLMAIKMREMESDVYPPGMKNYQELPELKCIQARDRSVTNPYSKITKYPLATCMVIYLKSHDVFFLGMAMWG